MRSVKQLAALSWVVRGEADGWRRMSHRWAVAAEAYAQAGSWPSLYIAARLLSEMRQAMSRGMPHRERECRGMSGTYFRPFLCAKRRLVSRALET